eukprot:7039854-Pyramimonas_sp.AAC.1
MKRVAERFASPKQLTREELMVAQAVEFDSKVFTKEAVNMAGETECVPLHATPHTWLCPSFLSSPVHSSLSSALCLSYLCLALDPILSSSALFALFATSAPPYGDGTCQRFLRSLSKLSCS